MSQPQPPLANEPRRQPLKTCPDCGGILQPSQPLWIPVVDLAAAGRPKGDPPHWQCHICGYRD